jgi:hypothetical protein
MDGRGLRDPRTLGDPKYRLTHGDLLAGAAAWAEGRLVRVEPRTLLAWQAMPTATRWRFAAPEEGGL